MKRFVTNRPDGNAQQGADDDLEGYFLQLLFELDDEIAEHKAQKRPDQIVKRIRRNLFYDKIAGNGSYRYQNNLRYDGQRI